MCWKIAFPPAPARMCVPVYFFFSTSHTTAMKASKPFAVCWIDGRKENICKGQAGAQMCVNSEEIWERGRNDGGGPCWLPLFFFLYAYMTGLSRLRQVPSLSSNSAFLIDTRRSRVHSFFFFLFPIGTGGFCCSDARGLQRNTNIFGDNRRRWFYRWREEEKSPQDSKQK